MSAVLIQAFVYIGVLLLGYMFKRAGVFKTEDTVFLKKAILYLTMPAVAVNGLSDLVLKSEFIWCFLIGVLSCLTLLGISFIITAKKSIREKITWLFSFNSFNIGNFAIPFLTGLISTDGLVAICLFDVAMAITFYGINYSLAQGMMETSASAQPGEETVKPVERSFSESLRYLLKKIFTSPITDAYFIMIILAAVSLRLPEPILKLASVLANANPFLVMISIGILFELSLDKSGVKCLAKFFSLRYVCVVLLALGVYFIVPLSADISQALIVLLMAPVASVAPLLTNECGGDGTQAAQINSLSIICGIVMMIVAYGLT